MSISENKAGSKARILVIDDHPMLREGLIGLINQQSDLVCCGEASTVPEAQAAADKLRPDVAILDLRLKGGDGLELIKTLKIQFPEIRVLVLSQYEAPVYVERSLRAGAMGYLAKDQAAQEVLAAIRTVLGGQVFLTRGNAALVLQKLVGRDVRAGQSGVDVLTDRELHVLQLLGAGMSTRTIATELKLSFKTIETHRENIKRKLGLEGASQLLHFATAWAREQVALPSHALNEIGNGAGPAEAASSRPKAVAKPASHRRSSEQSLG
jgi:DNA-binding NarL/FixJ family response regulator